jgi:hypothetical protein
MAMRVSAGKTCHFTLASGPVVLATEISERPLHGRVGTSSVSDVAYQPDKDYTGPDEFELLIDRIGGQRARRMRLHVHVDVVD